MIIRSLILWLIRFYQKYLSFDTGVARFFSGGARVCRHTPSCSEYTYRVVARHGVIKGFVLGLRRVFSCNPWTNISN